MRTALLFCGDTGCVCQRIFWFSWPGIIRCLWSLRLPHSRGLLPFRSTVSHKNGVWHMKGFTLVLRRAISMSKTVKFELRVGFIKCFSFWRVHFNGNNLPACLQKILKKRFFLVLRLLPCSKPHHTQQVCDMWHFFLFCGLWQSHHIWFNWLDEAINGLYRCDTGSSSGPSAAFRHLRLRVRALS